MVIWHSLSFQALPSKYTVDVKIVAVYDYQAITESKVIFLRTSSVCASARVRLRHSLLLN